LLLLWVLRRERQAENEPQLVRQVVWITAGRLAVEGLALQLKLQKLARCSERDKTAGTWHAYQIVGGACAVAAGSHGKAADAGGGNAEKNDGRTALNF